MADRPTWPHLENLDRVLQDEPEYLDPNVELELAKISGVHRRWFITEKLHGFNGRFGIDEDGVPWVGSRNQVVAEGHSDGWDQSALQGFVAFAAEHVIDLFPGATLFGEWAGKGVQKGIDYGAPDFYAFGLMDGGDLQSWDRMAGLCFGIGIKTVPLISAQYDVPHPFALQALRDQPSQIASSNWEGVCLSSWPQKADSYGRPLIVKIKSPAFAETAREKKDRPAGQTIVMDGARAFAADYVTAMRLEHVLDQVREANGFQSNPLDVRHTGDVLRAMYQDVAREGAADLAALPEDQQKLVGKVVADLTKPLLVAARDAAALVA